MAASSIDVVVKIGGSACTKKAEFETLNEEALSAVCRQIGALFGEGTRIAIVHGAGSFGHKQAREFGISKGADDNNGGGPGMLPMSKRIGFAKTRLSVTTLNKYVVDNLIREGVPATTISPCPFVGTDRKSLAGSRLPTYTKDAVLSLLARGLVPVVHGDAVLDEAQGCAILSGDVWMVELCRELGARTAVFVTDVDGVLTKPPSDPAAQLIPEILLDTESGELELGSVSMACDGAHDVTGGLKTKLECAATVLAEAPAVDAVYIVRAGSDAAAEAMRGKTPTAGTTLRRKRKVPA